MAAKPEKEEQEKRSKLMAWKSKSRPRHLAKYGLYTIVKHVILYFQVNWI